MGPQTGQVKVRQARQEGGRGGKGAQNVVAWRGGCGSGGGGWSGGRPAE